MGFWPGHWRLNKKCFEAEFKNRRTNRQWKTSCQRACWRPSCLIHEAEAFLWCCEAQKAQFFFQPGVFQNEKFTRSSNKISFLSHASQITYFDSRDFFFFLRRSHSHPPSVIFSSHPSWLSSRCPVHANERGCVHK